MSDELGDPHQAEPNLPTPSESASACAAEARELIAMLLGCGLESADANRLNSLLTADAALRQEYQRQAVFHAMLQWRHGKVWGASMGDIDPIGMATLLEEAEREARSQAAEEAKERAAREAREGERRRLEELQCDQARRPAPIVNPLYLGAAAVAASVLWLAATFFTSPEPNLAGRVRPQPQVIADEPSTIATIGDSVDARLVLSAVGSTPQNAETEKGTIVSTDAGVRLAAGRYELASGVVGLQFGDGASVILESPATIDLESAERVRLVHGRLVGAVPPGAIGFTVETPTATIVDLGTEFGVAVTGADGADVRVFDGEVEVVAAASAKQANQKLGQDVARQRKRLRAGDSARAEIDSITDAAETSANLFWRAIPTLEELQEKQAYEKWLNHSRSLSADPDVIAHYTFNGQQPNDQLLLNRAGDGQSFRGEIRGAQWDAGRWPHKQALRFLEGDGAGVAGTDVRIDLPGRFKAITLAVWVNVDALREGHNGLLMTETWDQPGQLHWQILEDGRLHVGVAGDKVGETGDSQGSLGLGAWSHLAVVLDQQTSQASFYIDGANVGVAKMSLTEGVLLGPLKLGNWKPGDDLAGKDSWQSLHGRMDEVLVLGRAMSEKEIQAMYDAGKPTDR